ncbi:MAG: glycosyltransferase family 4 protein [Chloroflexi bacterium]|nr:glycosyltransferase family 4 protein [Chloroflexota bacterium]
MNVLMLTQILPYPPDSGPKVKTYNVIKYLAQEHRVTLASFVRGDPSEHVCHLEQYCQAVHTVPMERGAVRDGLAMARSLLTGQPWMMVRDDRKAMRDLVDRLVAEQCFDVAHADQLNMAQYAERVRGAFKILDAHNALWLLYKRLWETMSPGLRKLLLGRDWRLIKSYEGRLVRQFDAVLAVSHEDGIALQEAAKPALSGAEGQSVDATVIPIAVDTDKVRVVEREAEPNHILHIGTMYWPPNIDAVNWFIQRVYPIIRQQRPDVQFDVIGSRPPAELLALNDAGLGVNVTGYVEDPTPYQRRAAAMIVPLLAGGGMRVKILNGLAEGIPIVSTTLGYEGIEVTPGQDILAGDTPEEFAAQVLRLLNDSALGRELVANGRRLAEEKYDYRNACRLLSGVYAQATSGQRERL